MINEVTYKEGYTSLDAKLAQNKVGAIYIETLFYDHQQDTYTQEVKVYKYTPETQGWGKKIFEGTLKELIQILEKGGKDVPSKDATQDGPADQKARQDSQ